MEPGTFNEIELIVHPGYHIIDRFVKKVDAARKENYGEFREIKLSRAEIEFLKKRFAEYGRRILEAEKNPNRMVIVIKPSDMPDTFEELSGNIDPKIRQGTKMVMRQLKRFSDFAKKRLEGRFFEIDWKIKKEDAFAIAPLLSKNVKIYASGEYKNDCVTEGAQTLEIFLRAKGKKPQIVWREGRVTKNSAIPSASQRRKLQEEKKRRKLAERKRRL
ncbi:MAG: hypothetical protein V1672_04485 [Candidatus Diapherotrites archaeon]